MNDSALTRVAAGALGLTGILHLILAPEYLGEQAYIGVLFIAGGLASIGLAAWLWRRATPVAWLGSALVAAGMAVGFILSRTVGLPGFHESEWELSGIVSVMLEIAVVACAVMATSRQPRNVVAS